MFDMSTPARELKEYATEYNIPYGDLRLKSKKENLIELINSHISKQERELEIQADFDEDSDNSLMLSDMTRYCTETKNDFTLGEIKDREFLIRMRNRYGSKCFDTHKDIEKIANHGYRMTKYSYYASSPTLSIADHRLIYEYRYETLCECTLLDTANEDLMSELIALYPRGKTKGENLIIIYGRYELNSPEYFKIKALCEYVDESICLGSLIRNICGNLESESIAKVASMITDCIDSGKIEHLKYIIHSLEAQEIKFSKLVSILASYIEFSKF